MRLGRNCRLELIISSVLSAAAQSWYEQAMTIQRKRFDAHSGREHPGENFLR
jgi:hypothetical protein